jgi:hypothetical protein
MSQKAVGFVNDLKKSNVDYRAITNRQFILPKTADAEVKSWEFRLNDP